MPQSINITFGAAAVPLTSTFAVDEGGGVTSVYFDRVQCSTELSHIYKVTVS